MAAPTVWGSDSFGHVTGGQQHNFQSDAGVTMQEVYDFAFKKWYILAMKNLMAQIGEEFSEKKIKAFKQFKLVVC